MALGFGSKRTSESVSPDSTKDEKSYGDYANNQSAAENGGRERKMSRIGAPINNSISGEPGHDSDTDASVSIGKQMEMEAGNAIKYRTCSWQKVSSPMTGAFLGCITTLWSTFAHHGSTMGGERAW